MSGKLRSKSGRPKHRAPRSAKDLREAAGHVRYELDMLLCSAFYIPVGISSPQTDETKNLAVEAFLLHYRNLRAFLCPGLQRTDRDDVIASDYLDKPMPEDVGDPAELGLDRIRIDKLLTHLSYDRARYEVAGEKNWNPQAMVQRIQNAMASFFRLLPPDRRAWFGW